MLVTYNSNYHHYLSSSPIIIALLHYPNVLPCTTPMCLMSQSHMSQSSD